MFSHYAAHERKVYVFYSCEHRDRFVTDTKGAKPLTRGEATRAMYGLLQSGLCTSEQDQDKGLLYVWW